MTSKVSLSDTYFNKTLENSPEVKETDESFTSSQSGTLNHSMDSPRDISPTVDADLIRMESQLDSWCLDMKRNILVSAFIYAINVWWINRHGWHAYLQKSLFVKLYLNNLVDIMCRYRISYTVHKIWLACKKVEFSAFEIEFMILMYNFKAEFAQSKMALLERHKQALRSEKQR